MGIYISDLDDIHEPEPVDDGVYDVEIVNATLTPGDNARINVQVLILNPPEDNPNPPFIRPALFLPDESKEQWKIDNSKLALKRFYHLFNITPPSGEIDDEEAAEWVAGWSGKRAKCKVRRVHNKAIDREENTLSIPPLPRAGSRAKAESTGGLRTL